ncbi:hypothetical protein [Microbispora sp. H11081]|uniref:hypothetical protein n=1 Tax=Microbispora sp. H11081 TaxID=2729107 RepID=UPI0014750009|nr:hypothetical protein [Microbispora sp. H11081]
MQKRARQAITMALAATTLVTGASTSAQASAVPPAPSATLSSAPLSSAPLSPEAPAGRPAPAESASPDLASLVEAFHAALRTAYKDMKKAKSLPSGVATATSFWDAQTASGKPMRYRTLASPYWPLGTKVRITHKGKSAIGVVDDFGPAEWAVAQHAVPAIVDLSEKMMADLTGVASNTVRVRFEVLEWGKGRVFRRSGTGYDLAMGRR